jgi:hypothetical protein
MSRKRRKGIQTVRDPIAYTYEADIHCPKCAEKRFAGTCSENNIGCNCKNPDEDQPGPIFDHTEGIEKVITCGTCREMFHDERTPYEYLKWEFKIDKNSDPYGHAMGWLGDIADVLHWKRNRQVPAEWGYKPGLFDPTTVMENETVATTETETLVNFGDVLNRYIGILKLHGRDY